MKHPPLFAKQYKELGREKLHAELKRMIAQAQRQVVWFNASARLRLLPALSAMKELVATPGQRTDLGFDPGGWEKELLSLGLNGDQVRQWKHRTASETDIRHLLGEEEQMRSKGKAPSNSLAVEHLRKLTTAVMLGEDVEAEKLACAFQEMYGF